MTTNHAKTKPQKTYLSFQNAGKSSKMKTSPKSVQISQNIPNSESNNQNYSNESNSSTFSRFEDWSTDEIIYYYSIKIKEYEQEVKRQKELLQKRKELLDRTKSTKSQIYKLIDVHDSLIQQNSQIIQHSELQNSPQMSET